MGPLNLFQASHQWATRPDDERFATLQDLYNACSAYASRSREADISFTDLSIVEVAGDIRVKGAKGFPSHFSHYGFSQFCRLTGAPANYLRTLPPGLVCQSLNYGIKHSETKACRILTQAEQIGGQDSVLVRAVTSEKYSRIWNWEVAKWCIDLPTGWRVPPARPVRGDQPGMRRATADDVIDLTGFSLSIKVGDMIAPAGIYGSDHDCFIFLINPSRTIEVPGGREVLNRGCFWKNSEVGASSLSITTFLYDHVCGNHIVWGAKDVRNFRIRHVGQQARKKSFEAMQQIRRYTDTSMADDLEMIRNAKATRIAKDESSVVDTVFEKRVMSKQNAESAYKLAKEFSDIHGDPRTVWGFVSGVTRLSQTCKFADEREELDRSSQKLLAMAF